MGILAVALFTVLIYVIYKYNVSQKQMFDQALLTTTYLHLIGLLVESYNITPDDFKKQIWRIWISEYNSWPSYDFDKHWEVLCKACNFPWDKHSNNWLQSNQIVNKVSSTIYSNKNRLYDVNPELKKYSNKLTLHDLEQIAGQDSGLAQITKGINLFS